MDLKEFPRRVAGPDAKPCPCPCCQGTEFLGAFCEECRGLGTILRTVVLRGWPELEGKTMVIADYPPAWLDVEVAPGMIESFDRATQTEPPHWFIREDGNQVYRHGNKAQMRAERSARICELGFHQGHLQGRWLRVQNRLFIPDITAERKAKIERILGKIDAAIPRLWARMDELARAIRQEEP